MPGEKSGYNPGDQMADEFNEDARELTPEEKEREKELARKRADLLAQKIAERKSAKESHVVDVVEEAPSPVDRLKLGKVKDNRHKLSFGTSSTRRAKEAEEYGVASGRSEEGQETDHNREIKDIIKKFIFAGSFKLRTAQEKGKYVLRVLSGVEGHKDTRVILKAEGTMEDIKAKLENHLNHNYTRK